MICMKICHNWPISYRGEVYRRKELTQTDARWTMRRDISLIDFLISLIIKPYAVGLLQINVSVSVNKGFNPFTLIYTF